MILGDRIREQRFLVGLSQGELARAIGKDGQYISKLENKHQQEVNTKTLVALAEALFCSTDYLLGRTDEPRLFARRRHTAVA